MNYVPLKDTLRGFKGIISGEYDELPEQAFYNVGTIDEALKKQKHYKVLRIHDRYNSSRYR